MTEKKTGQNNVTSKRPASISWRPPAALHGEFLTRVQRSGLSTNTFLTKAVFGARPPPERAQLARLLSETARIHSALHDIALTGGNTSANAQLIEAAMDDLAEIRAALIRLDGKLP